jgi:dihydrofolate synthase/folylpolyglutamate synthase
MFQNVGAAAYKPGLQTSEALDEMFGHPHQAYKTIHIAGTNGKGSTSHLLAAILQSAGYKVGLYTSPHLTDFRERIKVNGKMINKDYVVRFVDENKNKFEPLQPSFFELTSTLAFDWFRHEKVDIAVIETGLGGRLDSTNIISPILSVITNISKDHTQYLGDTLDKIAFEKAGIIKENTPVVIGETNDDEKVNIVFDTAAKNKKAPLLYADRIGEIKESKLDEQTGKWIFETRHYGEIIGELGGYVQDRNANTVLASVGILREKGYEIDDKAIKEGFSEVIELTDLRGRWQKISDNPKTICDTGHNIGGWQYLQKQLESESRKHTAVRMIVGMVNDKDINGVLSLMPRNAIYYFTQASVKRAMPATEFASMARNHGLKGDIYDSVSKAIKQAVADSSSTDMIFVGGSTFIVADALSELETNNQ